jgi:hypothetical protein
MFLAPEGRYSENPSDLGLDDLADLVAQFLNCFVRDKAQTFCNHFHEGQLATIYGDCVVIHAQQMQLVCLKQHGCLLIVEHLCIQLQSIGAERQEFTVVIEENGCRCLLIVRLITRIKDLNAWLRARLQQPWRNSVSARNNTVHNYITLSKHPLEDTSSSTYPDAPVPKSIATMCVYCESSFKNAI